MSAKARYTALSSNRAQFLQRARHNALLTIPSLMPLEGHHQTSHLVEPYQGIGSRGVVHLSSRLLMALLPAGRPYMRLDLPPQVKLQNEGQISTEITKSLAMSEQLVQSEVEAIGWREATLMSLQQLMVAGNVLEHVLPDNSVRIFRLDQYVTRRDHRGKLLELVIEEKFDADALPLGVSPPKDIADAAKQATTLEAKKDEIELYTHIMLVREPNREFYRRTQEFADGTKVGSPTTWAPDDLPYFALRWSSTPGEDYGRSKVEEHIADLRSLDALEKAQLEMAAMASRNFIMVAPGAGASGMKNRLARALNGDVVVGDPNAVDLKSFDNAAGFQITAAQVETLRESLATAFLLLSAGQRDAERVTATEIERDIQELEAALGGTFSTLSLEMLQARTRILMGQMKEQKKLPNFPEGAVVPVILTGLEALSRERDVTRAMQAAQVAAAFGEQGFDAVKAEVLLGRAYTGLGFPDAVRTEDEIAELQAQRQQQAMAAELITKSAPGVAREAAKQAGEEQ